jgi:hypothetical protein
VVGNAAIVAAGTSGSIDVFASNATDLVIDINGYYASLTDLLGNTALGTGALALNTTGSSNTASGYQALLNNKTGVDNTANGFEALAVNNGDDNTASGYQALGNNATGSDNTASGLHALYSNIDGNENTAGGVSALSSNTHGSENTASGYQALLNNIDGGGNTASGSQALQSNTDGNHNTASGSGALQYNTFGVGNTAIGYQALQYNTFGGANTAIGYQALLNSTGQNDIALGVGAGYLLTDGSYNIMIGSTGQGADDHTIRMGDVQTRAFIAGIRSVKTGSSDAIPVVIDSKGQLGTVSSSRRFKEDIQDMGDSSGGLLRLRPVTFRYRQPFADGSKPMEYGLIAEEVAEVYPDLVAHSADGQIESVKYQVLDSMLLNELQKQNRELQAQKQHAQKQDETIRQQQEQNRKLEARLAALEALLPGKVPAAANAGQ